MIKILNKKNCLKRSTNIDAIIANENINGNTYLGCSPPIYPLLKCALYEKRYCTTSTEKSAISVIFPMRQKDLFSSLHVRKSASIAKICAIRRPIKPVHFSCPKEW